MMQNTRINEAKQLFEEGRHLKKEGRFDDAEICFRQALEIEPNYPACLNNLGNLLQEKGDFNGAISCFKQAINIDPNLAVAFCNLASALLQIEDVAGAKANYEQALRLKADFFIAHHNLGKLFVKEGEFKRAEVCFKEALRLQPNSAEVYFDLGNLLQQQRRTREAIECFRACVRHRPDHVEAYANLGAALQAQGALDLANFCLQRALILDPNHAVANFNLGLLLETQKKYEEALQNYQKALSLKPEWTQVYYNLMRLWLSLGNWNDYEGRVQELIRRTEEHLKTENAAGLTPLILSYFRVPLSLHREVASLWAAQAVRSVRGMDEFRKDICEKPSFLVNQPLRIGYISPDFRTHPVGMLIYEMFQLHDRTKFQVYGYSLVPVRDDYTITIECGCDVFRDISEMSTEAAAAQIQADEIQILIDLGGYTTHTRPEILALQPAPIQCSYLGYPGTMGADFIKYIIADRWLVPPNLAKFYTEEVIYLPSGFVSSKLAISEVPVRRVDFGVSECAFVFCCFNAAYKIEPVVFASWMRILQAVPDSVLWLSNPQCATFQENIRYQAESLGVSADRLIFAETLPFPEYMARCRLADLFLDTFVYNAGSTAIAVLQAGVPVLTVPGDTYASRMGASVCAAAGLEEMICNSSEEYEKRAIYFATHRDELAKIRQKLEANLQSAALFDTALFVRNLEAALLEILPKPVKQTIEKLPKISLVMRVYNSALYLDKAIASVVTQTYQDWELIIWDDGSTDASVMIAQSWGIKDSRIRFYSASHQGLNSAWRAGYALCRGEYFGNVDSDDLLAPAALEETVDFLDKNPNCGLVYTDRFIIDSQGNNRGLDERCKIPYNPDKLLVDLIVFHFRLFRRSVFEAVGGISPEFETAEDYDFCLKVSEVGEIKHLQKPLYYYRVRTGQITQEQRPEVVRDSAKAINNALIRRGLAESYYLEVNDQQVFRILRR